MEQTQLQDRDFGLIPTLPLKKLSIVQHNCLRGWNVFLFLFNSLKTTTLPPLFVLLQDPYVFHNQLPVFAGFKVFAPDISSGIVTKVARYISSGLLHIYPILSLFFDCPDWMTLDIHILSRLFNSNHHMLRIYNSYMTNGTSSNTRTIAPDRMFIEHNFPYLVAEDFNIHNPLSDPLWHFSSKEIAISASYFEKAADLKYSLINTPGIFTRFPFVQDNRPAV